MNSQPDTFPVACTGSLRDNRSYCLKAATQSTLYIIIPMARRIKRRYLTNAPGGGPFSIRPDCSL